MTHIVNKIINKIENINEQIYSRIFLTKYPLLNFHLRKKRIEQGDVGIIFMLHRIADKDKTKLPPNENLKISPKELQKTINKYRHAGFDFLSLDEIYQHITNHIPFRKSFVAFTIDDGYADNYYNAYPIFKRNNVPFCIYIATDFPDKKAILWWFGIEDILLSHNKVVFNDKIIPSKTWQQKWDGFRIMRENILQMSQKCILEELKEALSLYEIHWLSYVEEKALTWKQITEMSKDPLCTIGGHTISHSSLQNMDTKEAISQIVKGDNIISSHINKPVMHFSLPYGREYPRTIEKELKGITTIVYADGGCINKNENYCSNEIAHLPRQILA